LSEVSGAVLQRSRVITRAKPEHKKIPAGAGPIQGDYVLHVGPCNARADRCVMPAMRAAGRRPPRTVRLS
jgi:hypothetical protein